MTTKTLLRMGVLALALQGVLGCSAPKKAIAIEDASLGLSKTLIATEIDATPEAFDYGKADPGSSTSFGVSYHTAPPMITHTIQDMVPIRQDFNLCKDCHVQPDLIGQKIEKGIPTPSPRSHYVENTNNLYMGRWNCIQCHVPQATVQPLVANIHKP